MFAVDPRHKNHGYGQLALIYHLKKLVEETNMDVYVKVNNAFLKSRQLAEIFGVKLINTNTWVGVKRDGRKSERPPKVAAWGHL